MEFSSALKGSITETLVHSLLREAGYPVVHTSIETVLPGLSMLDWANMARLELGSELRLLPDLLVLPQEGPAVLLEVKYRTRLDRETVRKLAEKVRRQHAHFPGTCTVLLRGTSPKGANARADDLIRVLPNDALQLLGAADLFYHHPGASALPEDEKLEPLWSALRPLTTAFPRLQEHRTVLEGITPVIRSLAEL